MSQPPTDRHLESPAPKATRKTAARASTRRGPRQFSSDYSSAGRTVADFRAAAGGATHGGSIGAPLATSPESESREASTCDILGHVCRGACQADRVGRDAPQPSDMRHAMRRFRSDRPVQAVPVRPAGPGGPAGAMGSHHTRERVGARRPALSRCAFLVEKMTKAFSTQPRERQLGNAPPHPRTRNFSSGTWAVALQKSRGGLRLVDVSRTPSGTFFFRCTLPRKWLAKMAKS